MKDFSATLLAAVRKAGAVMKAEMHARHRVVYKEGVNNVVTEVDMNCEKVIIDTIQEKFPTHSILSEERGRIEKDPNYEWIIDPIDGTMNFLQGIPLCVSSVALKVEGVIKIGAIYNPFLEELFFAEKGKGAFLNDRPLSVNKEKELEKTCLVTGFLKSKAYPTQASLYIFQHLVDKGIPVRRLGTSALNMAWVAAGRFAAYYQLATLHIWDIAASWLILEEAGGKLSNMNAPHFQISTPGFIASNGHIHETLSTLIHTAIAPTLRH